MLDTRHKFIGFFVIRGRLHDCDVYYLSRSYSDLSKLIIRNKINVAILFQQTLKDVDHVYIDMAGFDMPYDRIKQLTGDVKKYVQLFFKI